ncbi:unnamed protein product, partial [Tuber aestivum]
MRISLFIGMVEWSGVVCTVLLAVDRECSRSVDRSLFPLFLPKKKKIIQIFPFPLLFTFPLFLSSLLFFSPPRDFRRLPGSCSTYSYLYSLLREYQGGIKFPSSPLLIHSLPVPLLPLSTTSHNQGRQVKHDKGKKALSYHVYHISTLKTTKFT